jgi:hypothetical protein
MLSCRPAAVQRCLALSPAQYNRMLLLLCSCRGSLRRQNEKAHLIGHVKDVGVDSQHQDPTTRIYLTSVAQPWHVDGTDVVGE